MNLADKYLPKETSELQGQDQAVKKLRDFIDNFKKGKAALLYGPVGSGKTSAVHALANELGKDILEVNASDSRNKDNLNDVVGSATQQTSLFSFNKGKIILIDEVDGIAGREDRGGTTALTKIISESPYPIVMTANDPFDKKFSNLRKKSEKIQFHALRYNSVFSKLKDICEKEGIGYDESVLRDLSRRAGGDMRAAITDLEMLSNNKELRSLGVLSERDKEENMMQALVKVFKTKNTDVAKGAFDNVSEDINQQILWLEENLSKEYEGEDLANGFDCLSKADVYLGRIRRRQHWRFLVYAFNQISSGIALAKKEKYKKFNKYQPPKRVLKLWMAKMKYKKRGDIAEKIANVCRTSSKRVIHDILPYVRQMIKNGNEEIQKEFDLTKDEVEWLKK